MVSLEISAKRILERSLENWRSQMLAATILDSLAHDYFVSLHNERTHWRIVYCNPRVESGELKNKTLDKLIEDWSDMLAKWDEEVCHCGEPVNAHREGSSCTLAIPMDQ